MDLQDLFLSVADLRQDRTYVYFVPRLRSRMLGATGNTEDEWKLRTFSGTFEGLALDSRFALFTDVYKQNEYTGEFEYVTSDEAIDVLDITKDPILRNHPRDERIRIMRVEDWEALFEENNGGAGPAAAGAGAPVYTGNTGGTGGGRRKYRKKSAKKSRGVRKLSRKR